MRIVGFFVALGLLAVAAAALLGWVGGDSLDLASIAGAAALILAALVIGSFAALSPSADSSSPPESEGQT